MKGDGNCSSSEKVTRTDGFSAADRNALSWRAFPDDQGLRLIVKESSSVQEHAYLWPGGTRFYNGEIGIITQEAPPHAATNHWRAEDGSTEDDCKNKLINMCADPSADASSDVSLHISSSTSETLEATTHVQERIYKKMRQLGKTMAAENLKNPLQTGLSTYGGDYFMRLSSSGPWMRFVDLSHWVRLPYLDRLHEECVALVTWLEPTSRERDAHVGILSRMTGVAHSLWPGCRVEVFGSVFSSSQIPFGDIDISVSCLAADDRIFCLDLLARNLHKLGFCLEFEVLAKAEVPILKFVDSATKLLVDVTINQMDGPVTSMYLRDYATRNSIFRPLILILKLFLRQHKMNDTHSGGIGSYLVSLMLIVCLQSNHHLTVDPPHLGQSLMAFFQLYGVELEYHKVGVSLKDGKSHFFPRCEWRGDEPKTLLFECPVTERDLGKRVLNMCSCRAHFRRAHITILGGKKTHLPMPPKSVLAELIEPTQRVFRKRNPPLQQQANAIGKMMAVPKPDQQLIRQVMHLCASSEKWSDGSEYRNLAKYARAKPDMRQFRPYLF
ncbi:MAG: uncharacterized protein KVP18_003910 [Porospora cf. gigantea A]|uniref:uncharacterized protein n=1 Tax=Porospora cf. gigantea A TaxID=2853593 RepID=UPI003559EED1|nr:MAG: hypothetical protein KVP18_003910 [Porospora cf. gigantea A]